MFRKFANATEFAGAIVQPRRRLDILPIASFETQTRARREAIIRALCHSAYIGDHVALCRILGRYKIFVDTRDVGIAPHLMLDGYWEMWVTEAMISLVRAGMVVADVGANLGYYSLLLADLVGPSGQVHAFEPNPRMTSLLRRSLSVNGFLERVQVHQVALGAENDGEVALIIPPDDPKNAHIMSVGDHENAVNVPLARLDQRPDWSAIEFAKIDVEGAEQLVWAGARGLLDNGNLKTVLLEFAAARYHDPAGFLRSLMEPGFRLAHIDMTQGICDAIPAELLVRDPHVDIMLVLRR